MASPIVASDFTVVEFSGDLCTQIQQLVAVNNKLQEWFEWAFDSQGEPTTAFIATIAAAGIPVGGVVFYTVNIVPTGWLLCNGQAVNRTTYSRLFATIGTNYGIGNGTDTFNVPNFQGRFLYGSGTNKSTGDTGGSEEVTLAKEEIPLLDVEWQNPTTSLAVASQTVLSGGTSGASPLDIDSDNSIPRTSEVALLVGDDDPEPHDNMPPFSAGLWLIRY